MARVKKPILDYFPYDTPRKEQVEVLETIEKYWSNTDVFVIVGPTAVGKTALSSTIGLWGKDTSIITPTNLLVEQFAKEFWPAIGKLQKRARYQCDRVADGKLNCEEANRQYGGRRVLGCNTQCPYISDLRRARARGVGVYNYYTYLAHKLHRSVLIADEAHGLIPTIQELEGKKFWRHDHHYPSNLWNYSDVLNWLESIDRTEEQQALYEELYTTSPKFVIERSKDLWRRTTPPELRELLKIKPVDIRDAMPYFWSNKTKKIVLMSATISRKDVEALGLDRRRVIYLEVSSPIPVANRPIVIEPVASVNRNSLVAATKEIVEYLKRELLDKHKGEKGVIHATYQQARLIKECLGTLDGRVLYHTKDDTASQFEKFSKAPPESGKILVASGLYEGIDLVDDLGRWQVIAKIPWLSLGDSAIRHKAELDQEWYTWETSKATIQACGRICRTPTDYGVTYVLDSSFARLYSNLEKFKLTPKWWKEALIFNQED